jgi:hypothetical protein
MDELVTGSKMPMTWMSMQSKRFRSLVQTELREWWRGASEFRLSLCSTRVNPPTPAM